MGNLKPGATYIYEHYNGVTFAREQGAPHNERFEIGRTLERKEKDADREETLLWDSIRAAARTNTSLQEALERVKILYHLSKNNGKE